MEIVLLFSFLLFLLSIFTLLKLLKPTGKPRLPPGPRKLPIIGNLHQLAGKNILPQHRLQELARVHGPIMHLRLGAVPTVVISSADVAREVLRSQEANFANRPKLVFGKELGHDFSDIAFAPYGEYWRHVRKIATLELFAPKRIQSFRSMREEEVTILINSIASQAATGSVVELRDELFGLTFDITTRMVFNEKGKDQEAFRALTVEVGELLSGFLIVDLYPSIKLLQLVSGMRRKVQKKVKEFDKILDPVIEEHKINKRQGKSEEYLLDVLLKSHKDNTNGTGFSLTTNNIKAIILEIFIGGSESSSVVIEWAMSELLKNPKLMEKAQAEVRQVYGEKGIVDETRLEELKFLKLIIKETLRLYPPAPLMGPRESIEQCQVYGYDILPQTQVIVNAWGIGRDPNYWVEPNLFNPERFEDSSIDYKGNHFELIPFGAGKRMCPGMNLGVTNVELPLAMLLYHFDWKLPTGIKPDDLDMDGLFGTPMKRKNKLFVVPMLYTASFLSK